MSKEINREDLMEMFGEAFDSAAHLEEHIEEMRESVTKLTKRINAFKIILPMLEDLLYDGPDDEVAKIFALVSETLAIYELQIRMIERHMRDKHPEQTL